VSTEPTDDPGRDAPDVDDAGDPDDRDLGLLTPRKIVIQLIGFAVGLGLLGWCIRSAIAQGGWSKLAHADLRLVAAMLACTATSVVLNGWIFWVTIRSVRRLRFADMQWLNMACNFLNYAPIRLGAIGRVAYHARVDGLGLLQIGGWFALVSYTMFLTVGSCLVATLVHTEIDAWWFLLVAGQLLLGGAVTRMGVGSRLLIRHGRGVDRMLADRRAVWIAIGLRVVDIAAYTGRMWIALRILEIDLPVAHVITLAIVAIAAGLIPFGRLGFREFCVAAAAHRLSMLESDVSANMEQLALLESAGEAAIFVPLGAAAAVWYRRRWRQGRRTSPEDAGD